MGRERTLFGTDGIRGMANVEPVTGETAFRLGRAAAFLFKKYQGDHRVVIGKDTRISGYMLEHALTSGICSMGVSVILVGPFTTPGIAFLTRPHRARRPDPPRRRERLRPAFPDAMLRTGR